jgi:hypothetical protein
MNQNEYFDKIKYAPLKFPPIPSLMAFPKGSPAPIVDILNQLSSRYLDALS